MIWPQCVLGTPWFQVSSRKFLVFKGYLPLPLTPTPRSKPELGQPLLSRERAKLRGRGRQRIGIHPWSSFPLFTSFLIVLILALVICFSLLVFFSSISVLFLQDEEQRQAVSVFYCACQRNYCDFIKDSFCYAHLKVTYTSKYVDK